MPLIREYTSQDRVPVIRFIEALQDYEAGLDALVLIRRLPEYGEVALRKHLSDIWRRRGQIFVAEDDGKIVGYVSGFIRQQTLDNLLGTVPMKEGFIVGLYVEPDARGQQTGHSLMAALETWFRSKGCTHMKLWVLANNEGARRLYHDLGYTERLVEAGKALKNDPS